MPRKTDFARYLHDARIQRRLTVAEVAEQVGVSTASINFGSEIIVVRAMKICPRYARD